MSSFTRNSPRNVMAYHNDASSLLGKPMWVITKPFEYHVGELGSDEVVKVPQGFLTDGSSLPKVLFKFAQPWTEKGLAVVLHDYLRQTQTTEYKGIPVPVDNDFADKVFTEALGVLGLAKYKQVIIKVSMGLWRLFRNYKQGHYPLAKEAVENAIRLNLKNTNTLSLSPTQVRDLIRDYPMLKEKHNG